MNVGEQRSAMTTSPDAAVVLTKEGCGRTIPASDIIPTVRAGEVIVVPRALKRVGFHQTLVETILNAIRDTCGSAEADQCRRLGLERLHEVLDGAQIERAAQEANRQLARLYARVMKAFGHGALRLEGAFYIHRCPSMRFMVPQAVASPNEQRFMRRENRGLLSGHPPHRDYWYFNPINSIDVWMAVGPVERENGLRIYTDMWGKDVIRDGTFAREDPDFGTPLTFALEPGDVAVFDNRQLHASVLNISPFTRVVFSGRMCPERPIPPRADALETTTLWSPLVGTRFERFAGTATKVSWVYAIERLKRRATSAVTSIERRVGGTPLRRVRERLRYRRADQPFGA